MRILWVVKELCDGCRMCEIVCSVRKAAKLNPYLARIKVARQGKDGLPTPVICRHCKKPLCQIACPVPGAMYVDQETGAVVIDESYCIACLDCVDACPFGAIRVGPDKEVLKCDLCGGDPVCVKYCPPRPEHSLPHLPFSRQSCLQYIETHRVPQHRARPLAEKE